MASLGKVILLACGSFNPVTFMHLRMLELARDRLGPERVIKGVVSPVSDQYSKPGLVSATHRLEMIRQALRSSDWVVCDDWECTQTNWSRTVQVLRHIRDKEAVKAASQKKRTTSQRNNREATTNDTASPINHTEALVTASPRTHTDSPITASQRKRRRSSSSSSVSIQLLCGADLLASLSNSAVWGREDVEEILRDFGIVCISRAGFDINQIIYDFDLLFKYRDNITIVPDWINNDISATKIRCALRRQQSVKYLLPDDVIKYIQDQNLYQTT